MLAQKNLNSSPYSLQTNASFLTHFNSPLHFPDFLNLPIQHNIGTSQRVIFIQADCILVQTKEVDLKPAEAARIFETNSFSSAVSNGEFIVALKWFSKSNSVAGWDGNVVNCYYLRLYILTFEIINTNSSSSSFILKVFFFHAKLGLGVVHKGRPHEGGGSNRCGQMRTQGEGESEAMRTSAKTINIITC